MFDGPPGVYTDITVGATHACALTQDSEAVCWDIESAHAWDTPPGPYTFIETDGDETCAITDEGVIVCWGSGGGPIPEDKSDPSHDAPPGQYIAFSWEVWVLNYEGDRSTYSCAVREGGEAVCWGSWASARPDPPAGPFLSISGPKSFGALGGEWDEICALSTVGEAVCWGTFNREYSVSRERYGEVGFVEVGVTRYAALCGLTTDGRWTCGPDEPDVRYTAISTGGLHDCGITEDGKGVCLAASSRWWQGDLMAMMPPDPSPGRYVDISGGDGFGHQGDTAYACGLTEAGGAICWKNVVNRVAPLDPAPPYVAVSDGYGHTCALTENGETHCWGWNNFGQLDIPQGRYKAIGAGRASTCALTVEGEMVCVGPDAPWDVPAGSYISISMRGATVCALTEEGAPVCWHLGSLFETPAGPFANISVSHEAGACALSEGGEVSCWSSWEAPHVREGLYRYLSDPCAITEGGKVVCWGGSQLGRSLPTGEFVAISMGSGHGCALTVTGEAQCWGVFEVVRGAPDYGSVDPPLAGGFTAISSSPYRACGLTDTGRVVCWGDSEYEEVPWWSYE
ncbi:MAG: RCC1 domain-containing protein [Chloroflexi bacterium]|nr:RCC1 domain-containing protein [Chloroflexota bacterium]